MRIGLGLAKNVSEVHGGDEADRVVLRKTLRRGKVLGFFAQLPGCVVGMEACGGARHWARKLIELGHDARLSNDAAQTPVTRQRVPGPAPLRRVRSPRGYRGRARCRPRPRIQ